MTERAPPRLPSKLWIGSYEFPVYIVPRTHPQLVPTVSEEHGSEGSTEFDDEDRGIYIASHLDARHRLEIVWHELTHAINWVNGLTDDEPIDEEDLADKHGLAWTQFLLDNPRFEVWLVFMLRRLRQSRKSGDDADKKRNDDAAAPVEQKAGD